MKRNWIGILALVSGVALLLVLLLTACDNSDNPYDGTTWRVIDLQTGSTELTGSEAEEMWGGQVTAKFSGNRLRTYVGDEPVREDKYTYENGVLAIEGETATVQGDTITYLQKGGNELQPGQTIVMERAD